MIRYGFLFDEEEIIWLKPSEHFYWAKIASYHKDGTFHEAYRLELEEGSWDIKGARKRMREVEQYASLKRNEEDAKQMKVWAELTGRRWKAIREKFGEKAKWEDEGVQELFYSIR